MDAARPDASPQDSGATDGGFDAGRDASAPSDAGHDASTPDAGPGFVAVSHPRELRAVWVSSVFRLDFPSSTSLTEAQARAELGQIVDVSAASGFNTILFQVRPESDALYASPLEPWSRFVSGTQGTHPGYDPLAILIELAHQRGIAVDAWINPYRAKTSVGAATHPLHVTQRFPEAAITFGTAVVMDPSNADVRAHVVNVVRDLTRRYDIDGVIVDDYFYPYPQSGMTFDDDATFAAHGGGMSRADWRRDNVNRMVRAVGEAVQARRPDMRWGVSPFGIYRPGMPEGVVGLDQYATLYADPLRWMEEGWVEYIAPQLYWPTTSSGQPYRSLLAWWDEQASASGRMLLAGNSGDGGFSLDEYRAEMNATRDTARQATRGAIWWSVNAIESGSNGLASMLASEYYDRPAATPPLVDAEGPQPAPPLIEMDQGTARITTPATNIRWWAVYRKNGDDWVLDRLVSASTTSIALADGVWAISAIDRSGLESLGVQVEGVGEPPEPVGETCVHSFGGLYADGACSASYQCWDGTWLDRGACGACACVEETGTVGCDG